MYIAVRIPVFYDPESQKSYKSDSGAGSRAGIVTPLGATLAEQLTIAFVRSIKCGMALPHRIFLFFAAFDARENGTEKVP